MNLIVSSKDERLNYLFHPDNGALLYRDSLRAALLAKEEAEGRVRRLEKVYDAVGTLTTCTEPSKWLGNWRQLMDAVEDARCADSQEAEIRRFREALRKAK